MAGYPYYSPPPPSPPCNDTTPTHPPPPPPPPPPPACMCNKTTPTSPSPPPPPSTRYSPPLHSRPPPSHSPPPSPACNETTPTVSPPTFPSLSPPPPPQHVPPPPSPYYSPPQPSLSRPPLSRPPTPSPPRSPPSPSPTPPPRSFSPQPPSTPSIAPPTYPPHKLPPPSPSPPSVPPPCHCVCPSPWAPPPNYYPSIAPNYYPSIAPSPQFLSPSNGQHTVVLTTFVSLGGVFFLAFITIGLLSMAIKKRILGRPSTGQPDNSHVERQEQVQTSTKIPASTSANQYVIHIGQDQKPVTPDQGTSHNVKEGKIPQQTSSADPPSNQSLNDKISADPGIEQTSEDVKESNDPNKKLPQRKPLSSMNQESIGDDSSNKLGKPLSDQSVSDNMNDPEDEEHQPNGDEEKLDERNQKPLGDTSVPENATQDVDQESNADQGEPDNTTQDVEQESNAEKGEPDNTTQDAEKGSYAAEDESSNPKNKLRPRKKNNGRKGKQGGRKSSTLVDQARKAATNFVLDGEEECQDDDNDEEESQDVEQESNEDQGGPDNTTQDDEKESNAAEDESKKRLLPCKKNNGRNGMQAGRKSSTVVDQAMKAETNFDPDEEEESQDDDNDEEESQDVEQESNADQGGPDNTTQDVEKESNAAEGESKKRSLPRKKNNGRNGKQGGRKTSTFVDQAMMAATNLDPDEEEESQDVEQKDQGEPDSTTQDVEQKDQGEPDSTTQDVENESNAADDESKKRLHPGKRNNGRKGKQGGRKSATLVDQAMMAATNFDPDEEEESQDDDNDEEESQDVEQKFNVDQGEPDSITQDVENESNAADDESKNRLLPRKKNNGRKGKQGGRKSSTLVDQAMKATTNFDPDGEKEFQDDDNDDEEVYDCPLDVEQESSAIKDESNDSKARLRHLKKTSNACKGKHGEKQSSKLGQARKATINFDPDGEEEYQDDENDDPDVQEVPQEAEDEYNANEEESDERNHKPVGNQTETDNIDIAQDVEPESSAVEKESKNSKERLHPDKTSSGLKGKQGERKSSTLVGQAMKAAVNVHLVGALQGQDYDNDEAEEEKSYRRRNELPNLGQTVTVISGDNPGKEFKSFGNPDDKEEESEAYSSNQDLHRHKRHTSTQGRKESSNFVKKFSATIGANPGEVVKSLNVDQILNAPVGGGDPRLADDNEKEENDDSVNECDDPSMECESFVDDNAKKEESKAFGSKKVLHLQKRQTGAQRRKNAPDVGQTSTSPIGGDIGVDLKSFADDYAKQENEDPSIECDDPNMEYELRVDDDAKEEKSDSFGSKKDSRLHKRQIGARGRRDPRNVGQIWSDPLGGDPSTYSLADDDEKKEKEDQGMECDDLSMEFESLVDDGAKEEESESFGLKKVTFLQKRQIGGRGSKGPPNVGQILNIPTGGDAGEDLKFLADEQKKMELFDRKEVSPLRKHQAGASGRKKPPNIGQILIATTGNDPGVGLKSVDTQGWASNIGESMTVRKEDDPYGELESHDDEGDLSVTATNEGDTNAGLEFHEEDEELESECSNKGLGLHKPHALFLGEIEPSTDDQSVFVTGDDDPDESGKVARSGKPLSRPRTTGVRGKRRT